MSDGIETAQGEHPAPLGTEQDQGEQQDQDTSTRPRMSPANIAALASLVVEILRRDSSIQSSGSSNPVVAGSSSSSSSTTVQGILVT